MPGSWVGALLLLALVPGWTFLRLRQRHTPATETTGLGQLLEVVAMGVVTTGLGILVVLLVPHTWLPFLVDVDAWSDRGGAYAAGAPRATALTGAVVLLLACAVAWLADRALRVDRPEIHPGPGVWTHALRDRTPNTVPYVGLMLLDGKLVEGRLHSYTTETSETRDVAIGAPIRVTDVGGPPGGRAVPLDRVVVPEREIRYITVHLAPERGADS